MSRDRRPTAIDVGREQQAGGHVQQREQAPPRAAHPRAWAIGEYEREVEEQRRQHKSGDHVGPVEIPVEPVQPAERKRQRAEERKAEPEEMQRGRIVRAPQTDGRADEQREDADGGANDIERGITAGYGRDLDVEHPLLAEAKHRV